MGYAIHYKDAGLKHIFSLSAGRYIDDCYRQVVDVIHEEAPKDVIARISHRPRAWNLGGKLTDSIKQKLLALPFVTSVETDDERRAMLRKPKAFSAKVKEWAQNRIYPR